MEAEAGRGDVRVGGGRIGTEGPYLGGFGRKRTYKTIKPGSVGFVGATSAESPKIHAEPDPAELAHASTVLNRNGVRIM
jgi:hypothetical protein